MSEMNGVAPRQVRSFVPLSCLLCGLISFFFCFYTSLPFFVCAFFLFVFRMFSHYGELREFVRSFA